jgi:type I restriction enzyme, R subunit
VIDTVSRDEVLEAGFSQQATERARQQTREFRQFLEDHRDEIDALEFFYNRPFGSQPTLRDIRELSRLIAAPPRAWTVDSLWQAYAQLDRSKVRGSGQRTLTDLVSLIRYAMEQEDELAPFRERVNARFAAWLAQQEVNGRRFTPEQRQWLELIRDHIASSYAIEREDLDEVPFSQHGGLGRLYDLFGEEYVTLLDDLNKALSA